MAVAKILIFPYFTLKKPNDNEEEYIETNEYKEEDEKLKTMIETEITKKTKPKEQHVDNQFPKGIMI